MSIFYSPRIVVRSLFINRSEIFKRLSFEVPRTCSCEPLDSFHKIQTRAYIAKHDNRIFSMEHVDDGPKKKQDNYRNNKPKDGLRILKTRETSESCGASNVVDVHIVGVGGKALTKSVLINTSHSRYLFNCGEGLQRFLHINKLKIAKLQHVFVTSKDWSSIGGLVGLLLSSKVVGVPKITLHGPPTVESISGMCKLPDITKLEKRLLTEGGYEDGNLKCQYVPFFCEDKTSDETVSASKKPRLDSVPVTVSVAYVCTLKPSQRKINIEKCIELDIPPGPIYVKLKAGESVTLDNGRVINPEDILMPSVQPPSFIIVDCPQSGFLTSLINSEGFKKYQNPDENTPMETKVDLIIHLTPDEIVKLPEYQQWMKSFGADVQHIVFEDSFSDVVCYDGLRIQSQLNLLNPELFPLLTAFTTPMPTQSDVPSNIIKGENNLKYHYKPYNQLSRELLQQPDLEEFQSEMTNNSYIAEAIENYKQEVAKLQSEIPKDDRVFPEIVFLGTGASVNSKYRNFSGILLRLDENNSMILDCGEGTFGQLKNHYGKQTDSILRTINGVFVSHMHADHHLGLSGIMQARLEAFRKEKKDVPILVVAAPRAMKKWIDYIDLRVFPISSTINLFALQRLLPEEKLYIEKILKLDSFNPVDVNHCIGAQGLCLEYNGFKLVYSGDTMPCFDLVQQGKNCDLLIHEATFDEGMEEEARFKTHSTTTQAIEIGQKMNAKQIILTHFSQRYSKVPVFTDKFTSNVGIAFDHMKVRPCDYPYLSLLLKPLTVMFEDAIREINHIKKKQQKKNDLNTKW